MKLNKGSFISFALQVRERERERKRERERGEREVYFTYFIPFERFDARCVIRCKTRC